MGKRKGKTRMVSVSQLSAVDRLIMLTEEIAILESRLQPHDTGHIHTTIGVLKERVFELREEIDAALHATQR